MLNNVPLTTYSKLKQSFELIWYPYDDAQLAGITTMSDFELYITTPQILQNKLSGSAGNNFDNITKS